MQKLSFFLPCVSSYIYTGGRPFASRSLPSSQVLAMPRQPRRPFPATHPPVFFSPQAMFFIAKRCFNSSCEYASSFVPSSSRCFFASLLCTRPLLNHTVHNSFWTILFGLFAAFRDTYLRAPCLFPFPRGNLNLDRLVFHGQAVCYLTE